MIITLEEYFKGQDYHTDLVPVAQDLLTKFNRLMVYLHKDIPDLVVQMTSGYRSPIYNASVGGKSKSKHMSAQALDAWDPRKRIAIWCVKNRARLEEQGLWCEDPRATKNWMHFQSVPPGSGARFFIPDVKSIPLCQGPLTEESINESRLA